MKKLIMILLCIAFIAAISTTVLADDVNQDSSTSTASTTVSFEVSPTYTIAIPATVTPSYVSDDDKYVGTGKITASAVRLAADEQVQIRVAPANSDTSFEFNTDENASLAYAVSVGGINIPVNGIAATFGTLENWQDSQSVTLVYTANDPRYAGTYTDAIVFTVSVVDTGI